MSFDVHLYFSGTPGGAQNVVDTQLINSGAHRLSTFAYPKEALHYLRLADQLGVRTKMIIDSGAFTAWSVGKPVQLADLLAYNDKLIRDYGDRHEFMFIALDKIPGERGRRATQGEIDSAIIVSYNNFVTMQQHLHPRTVLPVYHSGEDRRLLECYLKLTDYICLSMDQGMSEHSRLEWAKRAIVPGARFHGLAATGNRMVSEVAWHSVDSSSWLTVGSMGGLLWPQGERFRVLAVSKDSPNRHDAGAHITTLSAVERAAVERKIVGLGFDPELLATDYKQRHLWNVAMWLDPPWRVRLAPPMDLFGNA